MANYGVKTVRVKDDAHPRGVVINRSQFDGGRFELWEPPTAAMAGPSPPPSPAFRELPGFDLADFIRKPDVIERLREALGGPEVTAIRIREATKGELVEVSGIGVRLADMLKSEAERYVEAIPAE